MSLTESSFMPPSRSYAAFLFDMDGTLLNSIPSAIRAWTRFAQRHDLPVEHVLSIMHGVRAIETIRRLAPAGVDPVAEAEALTRDEIADVGDVVEIPGAAAMLATLPPDRWALVTSAPRALARARLAAAGLPFPAHSVTADDVSRGKPAPDAFLLGARRLGVDPADCLVWEDTVAGITAAEAAGADVIAVTATHAAPMATPHATITDYRTLSVTQDADGRLMLHFDPEA